MSGKKISITGLTLLLVLGMFYFLFNSKAEIIPEAEKIYLETMNKSGHAERVSIDNPDDVETLKKIFSKKQLQIEDSYLQRVDIALHLKQKKKYYIFIHIAEI